MIQVEGLTRYYGQKRAISDVTFGVNKGEILGLLGPNAAGKTTTMRILTCFMPPSSGKATVAGFDIMEQSMDVRRITGYLPENPPLYMDMSTRDYLEFVAKLKGVPKENRKTEVDLVVEKASIGDVQQRVIGKLSKGFKQRVGLAQSLINNPQIIILDEPTVGLDPKQIIEIRDLIKNLRGEHTVILSSHILPEIEQTCDRVVIINDGSVVAEDTVTNLTNRMQGGERTMLTVEGDEPLVRKTLGSIDGIKSFEISSQKNSILDIIIETDHDLRKEIASCVVKANLGLLGLNAEKFTLEDIFLQLTTQEEAA